MNQDMKNVGAVLVVVEDGEEREWLRENVERGGDRVSAAASCDEALGMFEGEYYPIVLISGEMAGSREFCRDIRERDLPGYVFIIVVGGDEEGIEAEAGGNECLVRPFGAAELGVRLHTARRVLRLEKSLEDSYVEMERVTTMDPLTAVYNRSYISTHLPKEIAQASRYGLPLSVVMCDIDHFRHVNDSYGHQAGGEVLEQVAACLRETVRLEIDWVARYGGEEFLIVLPQTRVVGAVVMAERVRKAVAEVAIEADGKEIGLTASFGVVGFDRTPSEWIEIEKVVEAAESQLLRAKEEGRDKVMSGPPLENQFRKGKASDG